MRMRSGFSLFEMVLVLGILALTAALVWPSLETMYGDSQLQNASDTIRSRLIAARSDAMEDGKIYLFRFTPGGANYQIVPYDNNDESESPEASKPTSQSGTLPSGLLFFETPTEITNRSDTAINLIAKGGLNLPRSQSVLSETDPDLPWSDPVVFQPDGTCGDLTLIIATFEGNYVELNMQSITGIVKVTPAGGTR